MAITSDNFSLSELKPAGPERADNGGRGPFARSQWAALTKMVSLTGHQAGPRDGGNSVPFIIYAGSNLPQHRLEAENRGAQGSTKARCKAICKPTSVALEGPDANGSDAGRWPLGQALWRIFCSRCRARGARTWLRLSVQYHLRRPYSD